MINKKSYILKAPENLEVLKAPCITGVIPDAEKKIIFDAKIHIPPNYFEEGGTYTVIPSDSKLLFHSTNHELYNNSSFDISCNILSEGTANKPHYLYMEDKVRLFNNQVSGKKVFDWDGFDYDKPPAGFLLLDKKVKEMLLINDGLILVSGEPEIEKKYVKKGVLKTKPTNMRELGRKIIPVIMSSC
jgi:hypothetical protein